MSNVTKAVILVVDIILFIILLQTLPLDPAPAKGLALLIFIGILWLTEALHVTVTALLVPILAAILGILPTNNALAMFADSNIFLFFGGFALAAAMHIQKLDKMIAIRILHLAKGNFFLSVLYLFSVTAFLSMWMSNTATAAMLLPLAMGMLSNLDMQKNRNVFVFVLLGIAYSASIGGIGTLVGSPPNAIVASNLDVTFAEWFTYGMPVMIILMPVMILVMYLIFRPSMSIKVHEIDEADIPMTKERVITLAIFVFIALSWIFSGKINPILSSAFGLEGKIASFDSVIAIIAAVLVVGFRVVTWKQVQENCDWGVLYLFGGGLALSLVLSSTGASKVLSDAVVVMMEGSHYYVIGLMIAFFIIFLTEFTSNTASAALLVPIFITIAESIGAPPLGLALIIGVGASCAFMLPVATPPNAIVFGTGHIKQSEMVRTGVLLNVVSAVIVGSFGYFFWLQA